MVDEGALAAVVHSTEAEAHEDDAFAAPTAEVAPKRRRRSSKQSRAKQDQRKLQRRVESFTTTPDGGTAEPGRAAVSDTEAIA